ncbi:HET-domain-containing protein [Delitschia confertaspora ATCC 74209]|uniref:HET-domain-containing protein n=1 Tax=Delitschia confertaspora ATCC 74209 TaxID=1513339 RepID=A0A9P4MLP5_9PLEO|nr:HET-domain-containing protein [Delitschia confertaspora ATCC 74209]
MSYNAWHIYYNHAFAKDLYAGIPLRPLPVAIRCCPCCSDIVDGLDIGATFNADLSNMRTSAESCSICRILLRAFELYGNNNDRYISVKRKRSALIAGENGPRLLRFCTDPEDPTGISDSAPVSLPILLELHHLAQFQLLRAWLHHCDKSHDCNEYQDKSEIVLPTRLLYVGDTKDPGYVSDFVRLVFASDTTRQAYIALSHCWGDLPVEERKMYCTTQDNINRRLGGFSISELPKTFQDAIKVTRELGILYLWIDSLCIIQYEDNDEDWKRESSQMENVFSAAYCTIAASSAIDSNAGFLERHVSSEYVHVQNASGKRFYITTDIDDFDNDVGKAPLNTRAWVMQEGVLARRTIHFSANQMYWECGEGVWCENLTRLKSPFKNKYFTLDPHFPKRLVRFGDRRTVNFISFLFQDYSKRHLTVLTDRHVAISGLEGRIRDALKCQSRYGIFQKYLHRNLLWKASDSKVKEILYDYHVPSWSWMAYSGGIQFIDIPFNRVDWIDNLRFDEECTHTIITNVWIFQHCTMKLHGAQYTVLDFDGNQRGWVQYDIEDSEELDKERCVVVGRRDSIKNRNPIENNDDDGIEKYYILVVRPTGMETEYKRVGVGLVQIEYLMRWEGNVRIV